MNRAQRRRQEAGRGKQEGPGTPTIERCLDQGRAHQQAGRLVEAEQAYRQALDLAPQHPEALHLLGLVNYRLNRLPEALEYLQAAVDRQSTSPIYWFNLGVVSQRAGRAREAVKAYETSIRLNPRSAEAYGNLGNVLRDSGNVAEAVAAYQHALELNPSHADTHNNLGVAQKDQGLVDEAMASYRRALTLKEAITSFEKALSIMPGYHTARYNLGMAWSWVGHDDNAVRCLQEVARAKHDHGRAVVETSIFRSRIKHDAEQIGHLLDHGALSSEHRPYFQSLQEIRERFDQDPAPGNRVVLSPQDAARIGPSVNRILRCTPPSRAGQGALNAALDVEAIEARYLGTHPEVAFIDNLLNQPALEAMRRFCREATIWKKDYENGYIGTFLGDGFASPLLFQIAEELRRAFPRIFKAHRLTQAWAFKQDSARRGLNIHADAAAVNVNFWITEDEANLNPETGGLVVYDKEAPPEWNFKEYNSDRNKPKILRWLKDTSAEAIKIPYRANRAVVFNSDLFHESDVIAFKDDYCSRRINITLLYGYRPRG